MPRYNKIFAGPVSEPLPQVQEAQASVAILPGLFVLMTITNGIRTYGLPAAGGSGALRIAEENYLIMKGVDDAYAIGETVPGLEMLDEQFFNVRIPTGVNVAQGAALSCAASGKAALATNGQVILCYAEEPYNNTTGADQLIRVRAAKGLRAA